MTPEFWAIIGVGVALGTLTLTGHHRMNVRLDREIGRLDRAIAGLGKELGGRLDREIAGLGKELGERLDREIGRLDRGIAGLGKELGGKELGERLDRLDARLDRVEESLSERRERVAYVEGVLEGLRDALLARGLPVPPKVPPKRRRPHHQGRR